MREGEAKGEGGIGSGGAGERETKRREITCFMNVEIAGELVGGEGRSDSERGKERQRKEAAAGGQGRGPR